MGPAKIFGLKNSGSKTLGSKIFLGSNNFVIKKYLVLKNKGKNIMFDPNFLDSIIFGIQEKVWLNKFHFQKIWGPKKFFSKNVGRKKFWGPEKFGSNKM